MFPSVNHIVERSASSDGANLTDHLTTPHATIRSSDRLPVVIVMGQSAVQQAFEHWLHSLERLELILSTQPLAEIAQVDDPTSPRILLTDQIDDALEHSSWFASNPHWRVVLVADNLNDMQIQRAIQAKFSGVLSKNQPLYQIEAAIDSAARGERCFSPEISQRLIFSAAGLRLMKNEQDDPLASLTPREFEVLVCVARGESVKNTAARLGISASTVDNHKSRMMRKLRVHKAVELAQLAIRAGLLSKPRDRLPQPSLAPSD